MIGLQFVATKDLGSELIEWFSAGDFSHVDAEIDGQLLGARLDGGVAKRPQGYEAFSRRCRVELPCDDRVASSFREFLIAQLGKPYDRSAIVGFAAGRDWREQDSWFCSELVAAGLEHCGYFAYPLVAPANKITPSGLLLVLSSHVQVTL